jgi:pSer/pThr/pTyr-binding forkhead associated (FHA) protein
VPESVLTVLKYCFLALVYLFLLRVVQIVLREMRAPKPAAVGDGAVAAPTAPRKRGPGLRLRLLEPASREGETIPLGEELTVGRGGGCGIVLADDQFVSTVHARVFKRGDEVFVEDLGSRNGTFVNGHPVDGTTRLRRGDRVQFGQTVAELLR